MEIHCLALKTISLLFLISWTGFTGCSNNPEPEEEDQRPNILLLVADDLGYADLGCYGGDIATPNIDALAASGIRFSRFHTSPYCAPTRAMLLTGNDHHIAGMGRQGRRTSEFGYEGRLTDRVATLPAVLRDAGYHTYMAGKWHLDTSPESNPHQKGFEHSFVNLHGAGNHYNDQGIFEDTPVSLYTEDGRAARWNDGEYSTDLFTDKLIEYIGRHIHDQRPFFAFAAYTSPHWPLQVDEPYWKTYEGRYDAGYEELRVKRLASLKSAGMVPADAELPPLHDRVRPWDSLSPAEKKAESRKMELYAGMVDNLDFNIGRLLNYLKSIGQFDNTTIVFMSDNGAAAEDFYFDDQYGPFIRTHFNVDYENMGQPNSFISYGPQWAEAGSAPFRYFKGYPTEGGILAPMILTGPGVSRVNEISSGFATVMDIAPTCYELAKTTCPDSLDNRVRYPLKGRSLMPFASGKSQTIHDEDYVYGLEHGEYAMLRKGPWKIVNMQRPFRLENFELFYLTDDLSERNDLKGTEPEKYQELLSEWATFSSTIKVQFPTPEAE